MTERWKRSWIKERHGLKIKERKRKEEIPQGTSRGEDIGVDLRSDITGFSIAQAIECRQWLFFAYNFFNCRFAFDFVSIG